MIFKSDTGAFIQLETISKDNCHVLKSSPQSALTLIWFQDDQSRLNIDGQSHQFYKHDVVCLTEFHKIKVEEVGQIKLLRFNRDFYCILDHDSEVGCKGILFFGAAQLPRFKIEEENLEKFNHLWSAFEMEIKTRDDHQLDMLQMLLKRMLILSTRLYKEQTSQDRVSPKQSDIIREFNFLVEQHFRTKHAVSEYAELLHKSPKTLSNVFAKLGEKTPSQFIYDRILLESRRVLYFTDQTVSELAYALGFDDVQAFSRFFKRKEGVSPTQYRENHVEGKFANTSGNSR